MITGIGGAEKGRAFQVGGTAVVEVQEHAGQPCA